MLDPSRYDLVPAAGAPVAGAVVLHPHPDFGGDRFNPVVDALWRTLAGAGVTAVRFDFASSDLAAGVADALDAIDRLPADRPVWVCGYSFGAAVATHVVDERVAGWALVAPPLGLLEAGPAGTDPRPTLALVPAHDQFCPPAALRAATAGWVANEIEEIPAADHFLAGGSRRVAERVAGWVTTRPDRP